MIVVVADTSPLNYLIQINCEHILPALYEDVLVPTAVIQELEHPRALSAVRAWLRRVPPWVVVREVGAPPDPALAKLDPGERQAIQLAKQEHADLLLMDEKLGVRLAREQGLAVTGTLGVLLQAAKRGLVNVIPRWRISRPRTFVAVVERLKKCAVGRGCRPSRVATATSHGALQAENHAHRDAMLDGLANERWNGEVITRIRRLPKPAANLVAFRVVWSFTAGLYLICTCTLGFERFGGI